MKQKKQVNYRPKKRWGTVIIPLITLTVLVAVISAAAAGVWQLADEEDYVTPEMVASQTRPHISTSSEPQPMPPEPDKSSQEATSKSESSKPETVGAADYQVPKSEWAGMDYFDDVLFVGDSITEGIKIYDIMSNAKVLSYTGINIDNIFTKPVIKTGTGEEMITIIDAAKAEKPGKIYVMMGANSMGYDKETFIKGYGRLVDTLHTMHPEATLYVQSILPVTVTFEKNRPEFANSKIDDYNDGLRQMAKEKGLPYVNVAEVFKDENGALPTDASPKDGMHFSAQWYRLWFDYLREHVV